MSDYSDYSNGSGSSKDSASCDAWVPETIKLVIMTAKRLSEDYKNDKTESNKMTAFKYAHNAIILARKDSFWKDEAPSIVKEIAEYFDDAEDKEILDGFLNSAKIRLIPKKSELTIHDYLLISKGEPWGSEDPVKANESSGSKAVIDEAKPKKLAVVIHQDKSNKLEVVIHQRDAEKLRPIIHQDKPENRAQ
ncbi:hypothetical protein BM221_009254 [Beauveria bassiana]|uniref:Uncharacterized protein n=1 Tax=Beauveria bassiana TaxID=176275 RepID=A0A2N6NCU3_BEABA|nr:hypothetical protein BM221_009254 [Beauveria bassiana]